MELFGTTAEEVELSSTSSVFACSKIGLRTEQEDRVVVCINATVDSSKHCTVLGLFDGTAGDSASNFCQQNLFRCITTETDSKWCLKKEYDDQSIPSPEDIARMEQTMRGAFHKLDYAFMDAAGNDTVKDYCCSTGVVAVLWASTRMLTVAHVGDSRALLCSVDCAGEVTATWLTTDHKPNLIKEKVRILACGGSVVYLHGHKPYLRGGDFFQRHSLGHKPKQLNYSRAFGGKGLKKYGLIVDPDVQSVAVTSESRFVILGSDGLWDCLDPQLACELVLGSRGAKRCAAEDLVDRAIERMPNCGVVDNVSAIVLSVNELNHD